MRQFCRVLCGALFLKVVDSSYLKAAAAGNHEHPATIVPARSISKDFLKAEPSSDPISKSTSSHRRHKVPRQPQTPRPPMLELMSVSLENWGARSIHDNAEDPPEATILVRGDGSLEGFDDMLRDSGEHFNPLAQMPHAMNMFDSRVQQTHPLNFAQYSEPRSDMTKNLMLVFLALFVLLILAYLMSCLCFDASDGDADAPVKEGKMAASGAKIGESTWAAAYSEADGEQKEAFELLFRCNMISTEEFSLGLVSQEHIQECTWIAVHMLQHKPLEEWVGLWQQAQQSFEDSVADCFEAKGGQVGLGARALAQRLSLSRSQFRTPSSPASRESRPSSANLDFVSDASLDLRPLHS